jgi:hypothetical protein
LIAQGPTAGFDNSRRLIEHLLQAETTALAMRSVSHPMHPVTLPVHFDLAGFDFEVSPVNRKRIL